MALEVLLGHTYAKIFDYVMRSLFYLKAKESEVTGPYPLELSDSFPTPLCRLEG